MTDPTFPCKFCNAPSEHFCDTPNRYSRTSPLHHYRCGTCGAIFVGNKIDQDELTEAYASQDRPAYYEEIHHTHRKKMVRSLRDLRRRFALGETRILDLGTGNGEFAELLLQHGAKRVSAHDLPGVDIARLHALDCTVYQDADYRGLPEGGFDVVCLLDVLEHVLDPHHLLRSCFRALAPGGHLYVHTPVITRLDRMLHRLLPWPILRKLAVAWQMSRTTVYHLRNFTRPSLSVLLDQCGFDVIDYREENELSWPIRKYVRSFLTGPRDYPDWTSALVAAIAGPIVRSPFLNSNKAIFLARRRGLFQ